MGEVIIVFDKPEAQCPISDAAIKIFLLSHIAQVPAVQRPNARHCVSKVAQASPMIVAMNDVTAIFANHVHRHIHSASIAMHVGDVAVSPKFAVSDVLPTQDGQVQVVSKSWNHLAEVRAVSPDPFLQPSLMVAFNENFGALVRQCAVELVKPFARKVAVISNGCFSARIFVKARELVEVEQIAKTHEHVRPKLFSDADKTTHARLALERNVYIRTNQNSFHKCPKPEYHGGYIWGCA
jgi:hypothetical protein